MLTVMDVFAVLAFGALDQLIDNFTPGFYYPHPQNEPNVYHVTLFWQR
jgi:hypothetical protein